MRSYHADDVSVGDLALEDQGKFLDASAISLAGGGDPLFVISTVDDATFKVPSADRYVLVIPTDFDLSPLSDHPTVFIDPQHHIGLLTTVTDGLDFSQVICPSQQLLTAREELALKICSEAVTQNRNPQFISHIGELLDLLALQKLGLIHKDAIDRLFF